MYNALWIFNLFQHFWHFLLIPSFLHHHYVYGCIYSVVRIFLIGLPTQPPFPYINLMDISSLLLGLTTIQRDWGNYLSLSNSKMYSISIVSMNSYMCSFKINLYFILCKDYVEEMISPFSGSWESTVLILVVVFKWNLP